MSRGAFDIYRSSSGYVAVTNPVRRQILEALSEGEKELPDLVALTGKAKPTLSSVHMKDLLSQGLIKAEVHPRDGRRKVFHLNAEKIGSSNVPVDTLRDAVKEHEVVPERPARFPLSVSMHALAAAPPAVDPRTLRLQATALGRATGAAVAACGPGGLLAAMVPFLEQEGLARPLGLDLEHRRIDLAYGVALPKEADGPRLGALLAGYVEGAAAANGLVVSVDLECCHEERRCTLGLGGADTCTRPEQR